MLLKKPVTQGALQAWRVGNREFFWQRSTETAHRCEVRSEKILVSHLACHRHAEKQQRKHFAFAELAALLGTFASVLQG